MEETVMSDNTVNDKFKIKESGIEIDPNCKTKARVSAKNLGVDLNEYRDMIKRGNTWYVIDPSTKEEFEVEVTRE